MTHFDAEHLTSPGESIRGTAVQSCPHAPQFFGSLVTSPQPHASSVQASPSGVPLSGAPLSPPRLASSLAVSVRSSVGQPARARDIRAVMTSQAYRAPARATKERGIKIDCCVETKLATNCDEEQPRPPPRRRVGLR